MVMVVGSKDVAERVLSQLKRIARALYSNPPTYGARIAAEIVNDADMFGEWKVRILTP
jgi:aspartate aminotransferase